jgi:hypothetical protein
VSSWPYAVSAGDGFGLALGEGLDPAAPADGVDVGLDLPPDGGVGAALGAVLVVLVPGGLMHHDVLVTFVVRDLYAA